MARGKEAQARYNKRRKQREKLAAKHALRSVTVTEVDLLHFQLSHFGDATQPQDWFVSAQTAFDYDPEEDVWEEEDELGYYDDGVKRTLTDEQIDMFRHSELEQLARAERLEREEQGMEDEAPASPLSAVSSLDQDLIGLTSTHHKAPTPSTTTTTSTSSTTPSEPPTRRVPGAFGSTKESNYKRKRSSTPRSNDSAHPKKQKERKVEVPYEQRNKRKWEEHVASVEPVKGTWLYESKTENRLLREMDDVKAESVEMDY